MTRQAADKLHVSQIWVLYYNNSMQRLAFRLPFSLSILFWLKIAQYLLFIYYYYYYYCHLAGHSVLNWFPNPLPLRVNGLRKHSHWWFQSHTTHQGPMLPAAQHICHDHRHDPRIRLTATKLLIVGFCNVLLFASIFIQCRFLSPVSVVILIYH